MTKHNAPAFFLSDIFLLFSLEPLSFNIIFLGISLFRQIYFNKLMLNLTD